MPTDKKMKSLLQASEAACQSTTQHILLSVSADGRVLTSGADKLVTGLVSDVELYKMAKACLGSHVSSSLHELLVILPSLSFLSYWIFQPKV